MAGTEYDAIVVGSGPNGLAAAITLQESGLSVLLVEGKETIGGGMRTEELTLPGYRRKVQRGVRLKITKTQTPESETRWDGSKKHSRGRKKRKKRGQKE